MTSFITSSCCNGHRPRRYLDVVVHTRSELLSRLMRERQVARFLVAPSGYGKTFVAIEYAQVIFDFKNVTWISAQSPCFLRDLDSGSLAKAIMARDCALKLVVFDDVPRLGSGRAEVFSRAIDELLESSIEVMVTCQPSCDAYSGRQIDRICLRALDLLLSDAEVAAQTGGVGVPALEASREARELFEGGDKQGDALADAVESPSGLGDDLHKRIPQLVWGGSGALASFAMGIKREELPAESLAAMFLLMTLRRAGLSWACEQYGLQVENVLLLARDYPHLGLWREADAFEAIDVPQKVVYQVFSQQIGEILMALELSEIDDLAWKVADTLLELGQCARACDHMVVFCRKDARAEWVRARAERLFAARCILPAYYAGKSALPANGNGVMFPLLESHNAWRLLLLGDTREAVKCAMHAAAHPSASADVRAWALLLLVNQALNKNVLEGVLARLKLLVEAAEKENEPADRDWYMPAVCVLGARFEGAGKRKFKLTSQRWDALASEATHADLALWGASLALRAYPEIANDERLVDWAQQAESTFTAAHLLAFRAFKDFADQVRASASAPNSVVSLSLAAERSVQCIDDLLSPRILLNMQEAEDELMDEVRTYQLNCEQSKRIEARRKRGTASKPAGGAHIKAESTPTLAINVLGGFEVTLDGVPLTLRVLGQTKVRALLTLLVLADGRECSKANVVDALWPDLTERSGMKNLYTTWSNLTRALSLPDGTNPYLVRNQGSYRIVRQYVQTDIARVNQICKEVTMGQTTQDRLCELLDELNRAYKGDLLPSETKNEWILEERRRWRHQVTSLFANASLQLVDMNQTQAALWFSQIAMRLETKREDMYYALMCSQLACGQREAALETYRSCTKMLVQQYQIDPSIRMVMLYRSIIEHESKF